MDIRMRMMAAMNQVQLLPHLRRLGQELADMHQPAAGAVVPIGDSGEVANSHATCLRDLRYLPLSVFKVRTGILEPPALAVAAVHDDFERADAFQYFEFAPARFFF